MLVREEQPGDHAAVAQVHRDAFGAHGDAVAALVTSLRESFSSDPGLSLVATDVTASVVGHVMFTRNVLDAPPRLVDVQVLSPVGVLPAHQRCGVGSALIRHGLGVLDERGVSLVFLEGSPSYYPRFGFVPGGELAFRRPSLRIPEPAFQVHTLSSYRPWMTGTLVYRREFWDHDCVGLREQQEIDD